MKSMPAKKPMTIDDLAVLMQEQFSVTTQHFVGIDKRLGNVDKRLGNVDKRLGNVDKQLGDMSGRISRLDARVEGLDRDIAKLYSSVVKLEYNLRDNTDEISKLKDQFTRLLTTFDKVSQDETENSTERRAISLQVDRLNIWVAAIAKKTGIDLAKVKS